MYVMRCIYKDEGMHAGRQAGRFPTLDYFALKFLSTAPPQVSVPVPARVPLSGHDDRASGGQDTRLRQGHLGLRCLGVISVVFTQKVVNIYILRTVLFSLAVSRTRT